MFYGEKRASILQILQKNDFFLNGAGQSQISIKLIQIWYGVWYYEAWYA